LRRNWTQTEQTPTLGWLSKSHDKSSEPIIHGPREQGKSMNF